MTIRAPTCKLHTSLLNACYYDSSGTPQSDFLRTPCECIRRSRRVQPPAPLRSCLSLLRRARAIRNITFDSCAMQGRSGGVYRATWLVGLVLRSGCYLSDDHLRRFPEPGSFAGWQSLFAKLQNATYTAKGPLAFLPSWTPPVDDVPHEPLFLSSTGSREAFDLGVDLRKRYQFTKGGDNFTVWYAVPRLTSRVLA